MVAWVKGERRMCLAADGAEIEGTANGRGGAEQPAYRLSTMNDGGGAVVLTI